MTRPRMFVARTLPADVAATVGEGIDVEVFEGERAPTRHELRARAQEADAIVTLLSDPVDAELLDACPRVRVVANYAVGYDNIDVPAATARGVWVTNTPGVLTEATADLTWALILALARRLGEGERLLREGRFDGWSPTMLLGMELHGATLGIFGCGRIGRAVARRAVGFGMNVVYASRSRLPEDLEAQLGARHVSKQALLAQADVLSIHAPLDEHTRHAFGRAELERMQPHALLINTARGPIVDEPALAQALQQGWIGGAALDVYEHEPQVHPELLGRNDVVLLPHLGSATRHTRRRMAEIALGNAAAVLRGERPPSPVNEPPTPRA